MRPRGTRAASKRRIDYRPPAFVVDDVALEFDLDPARTEVSATFAFRRNPAAARVDRRAPLVLDGEAQENVRVELDGRALAPDALTVRMSALAIGEVLAQLFADLPGQVECGELAVREEARGLLLPTAIFARWSR